MSSLITWLVHRLLALALCFAFRSALYIIYENPTPLVLMHVRQY